MLSTELTLISAKALHFPPKAQVCDSRMAAIGLHASLELLCLVNREAWDSLKGKAETAEPKPYSVLVSWSAANTFAESGGDLRPCLELESLIQNPSKKKFQDFLQSCTDQLSQTQRPLTIDAAQSTLAIKVTIAYKSVFEDTKLAKAGWALPEIMYTGLQRLVIVDQSAPAKVVTPKRTSYMFSHEANLRDRVSSRKRAPQSAWH